MEFGRAVSNNSLVLGLFALLTTAAIATTYLNTREAIAEQEKKARAKALLQIVPRERHDNTMLDDTLPIGDPQSLGLQEPGRLFVARSGDDVVAFIIPSLAPEGYSGALKLLTGVNRDGTVAGVRVVSHNETPGLGDKVDLKKSDWVLGFDGRSLSDPKPPGWKVKKDKGEFDQFTGATITPRAVTAAVYQTLIYYREHRQALLEAATPSAEATPDATEDAMQEERDHG